MNNFVRSRPLVLAANFVMPVHALLSRGCSDRPSVLAALDLLLVNFSPREEPVACVFLDPAATKFYT